MKDTLDITVQECRELSPSEAIKVRSMLNADPNLLIPYALLSSDEEAYSHLTDVVETARYFISDDVYKEMAARYYGAVESYWSNGVGFALEHRYDDPKSRYEITRELSAALGSREEIGDRTSRILACMTERFRRVDTAPLARAVAEAAKLREGASEQVSAAMGRLGVLAAVDGMKTDLSKDQKPQEVPDELRAAIQGHVLEALAEDSVWGKTQEIRSAQAVKNVTATIEALAEIPFGTLINRIDADAWVNDIREAYEERRQQAGKSSPDRQGEQQGEFSLEPYRQGKQVASHVSIADMPSLLVSEIAIWGGEHPQLTAFLQKIAKNSPDKLHPKQDTAVRSSDAVCRSSITTRYLARMVCDGQFSDLYAMAQEMKRGFSGLEDTARGQRRSLTLNPINTIFQALMTDDYKRDVTQMFAGASDAHEFAGRMEVLQSTEAASESDHQEHTIEGEELRDLLRQLALRRRTIGGISRAEAESAYNYSVDRALTALYDNLVLFMQADCGAVGEKIVRYRQLAEQSIKRAATIIEGMSGLEQGTLLTEIDVDDWIARMVNEPPRKIAARGL